MPYALQPEQLRRSYDASSLQFTTTAEVLPATRIIGQPRGVKAIEFGLNMKTAGYNIFVLGASGTGRTTAIQKFVEDRATSDPVPSDWVYVHNFLEPDKPVAIALPAGKGSAFRDALQQLIKRLRSEIGRAFDNQAFRDAVLQIQHDMVDQREAIFLNVQHEAEKVNALLVSSAEGLQIVPASSNQPMQPQEFAALSSEDKAAWRKTQQGLQHIPERSCLSGP